MRSPPRTTKSVRTPSARRARIAASRYPLRGVARTSYLKSNEYAALVGRRAADLHALPVTGPPARAGGAMLPRPDGITGILPFRYADVTGDPALLRDLKIAQLTVNYPFDTTSSSFASSEVLATRRSATSTPKIVSVAPEVI